MEQEIISHGHCIYCNEIVLQSEMKKHLAKHLALEQKNCVAKKTETYCHIEVKSGNYFLHLLVDEFQDLEDLDYFLRDIWLECCGHLSDFSIKRQELDMKAKIIDALPLKTKINYTYDYGTSTNLEIIVHNHYQLKLQKYLEILSRNEPLKLICANCKTEPAAVICSVCLYNSEAHFCKACSKVHSKTCSDFKEYAKMKIVNSPRYGECGYEGGRIDKARDGIWKPKIKS